MIVESNRRLLKTFLLHMRPRTVRASALRFTYTWGLGGSAAALVLLLLATGVMLKFVYLPVPDRAYDSIVALHTSVPFGAFIRNIHHWSANLLVLVVFLHLLRVFYTGAYKTPRKLSWLIGLFSFGAILLSNFTGYLLPWDQLAYWAVTICTSMLAYLPLVGGWLQELIVGGSELGPQTLSNFFALHTAIIPGLILLLLPFHFWRIRKAGGLAAKPIDSTDPAVKEKRIEVIPHLIVRELAAAAVVTALVMTMAAVWDAPLGAKANPGLSPNPTKAPWYFAGLQELLIHFHPLLAVAIIPLAVVAALSLLPVLPFRIDTAGRWFGSPRGRRLTMVSGLLALIAAPIWVIGYASGFEFLSWLAPLLGLAMVAGVFWLSRHRWGGTVHEAVQAGFTFLVTVWIVLTITGVWFRGASMALVWPWQ